MKPTQEGKEQHRSLSGRARWRAWSPRWPRSCSAARVPIEPPICWAVLTNAEATPVSELRTPNVALDIDGAMTSPKAAPGSSNAGSTATA